MNADGMAIASSEVEVTKSANPTAVIHIKRRSRKENKAPEFIEVLPGKVSAKPDEELTIECSVAGHPSPAVEWLRNSVPLIPQPDRYVMLYDGESATLKFVSVTAADEGKYTCVAKNEHGEARTQMSLEVEPVSGNAAGRPPVFRFDKIKDIYTARDGDRVCLKAELVEGDNPISVRWLRNKMEVADSISFQHKRDGRSFQLIIADAFPEDAGDYICEAKNPWGDAKCVMRMQIESNDHSDAEEPPRITEAPAEVQVEPGKSVEIKVRASGHPDPVMTWDRGRANLIPCEKYAMSNAGSEFVLRVADCSREDAGRYTVTAVNTAGTATATVRLRVSEPTGSSNSQPKITEAPMSVQVGLGSKAELRCRFIGAPQPTCTWYRGDQKLIDGKNGISIKTTANTSELSILQVSSDQLGEYLCTVRNAYGEDLANAMILLEGSSAALPQRRAIRH